MPILREHKLLAWIDDGLRHHLALRALATVLAPILVLIAVTALLQTRRANDDAIAQSIANMDLYTQTARSVPLDVVSDANVLPVLPLLDQAADLPSAVKAPTQWFPGLSQTDKLGAGAHEVYRRALEHILLPRLIVRLENQVRSNLNQPAFLYEATHVYLMLHSVGPLDRDLIKAWMSLDWQAQWPDSVAKPLRDSLERHLAALLDQPLENVPLDANLIATARSILLRVPIAEFVYNTIRISSPAQALPPWRPADAAGPLGMRMFIRRSGLPLTEGVPGFFTIDGFYKVLLPSLPAAITQMASDSWVLGTTTQINLTSPQASLMQRDVIALYTNDYAKQWDNLLADLDIEPTLTRQQAVQGLYILASPQSPMRDLLTGITRQLTLTQPPPPPTGVASAAPGATPVATDISARLIALFRQANRPPPEPPAKAIEDRYATLIAFVGQGPGAPIDNVLKLLSDLQQQHANSAAAAVGKGAATTLRGGADPATLLRAEASRDPQPVARWLETITDAAATTLGLPRANLPGPPSAQIGIALTCVDCPAYLDVTNLVNEIGISLAPINETPPTAPSSFKALNSPLQGVRWAPVDLPSGQVNIRLVIPDADQKDHRNESIARNNKLEQLQFKLAPDEKAKVTINVRPEGFFALTHRVDIKDMSVQFIQ